MTAYEFRITNEMRRMLDVLLAGECTEPTRGFLSEARYSLDHAVAAHYLDQPTANGSGGADAPAFATPIEAWQHATMLRLAHQQQYGIETNGDGRWRAVRTEEN